MEAKEQVVEHMDRHDSGVRSLLTEGTVKRRHLSDVVELLGHKDCEISLVGCWDSLKAFSKVSQRRFLKCWAATERRGKSLCLKMLV